MDPNNAVVKLCAAGMAAEAEGRNDEAQALFERAWEASCDDFEACVAAHYVARHQATPAEELAWNQIALERADRVGDARVQTLYASLRLNLGHSLEKLGRSAEACAQYTRAAIELERLPEGPYARLVRVGIAAGKRRTCPTTS
jgi:tetratricopeptide (TPR) repeat protein